MPHRLCCWVECLGLRWDLTIIEVFAIVAPSRARDRASAHVARLASPEPSGASPVSGLFVPLYAVIYSVIALVALVGRVHSSLAPRERLL
jgi:hypothetical protein